MRCDLQRKLKTCESRLQSEVNFLLQNFMTINYIKINNPF